MKKSNEKIPDKLDYSKLPKEIEEVIEQKGDIIDENVKITYDGRQFLVRFPSEISKLMEITRQDKINFKLEMPKPRTDEKPKLTITLIKK
ncbi:hypothetical protein BEH94_01925 [Candidatus Altiarchaeales archaeon WOR_SM1_SCG]|nr:hypothetical protein BEH94_01925 [Candidatus Altiarchaeales archaeon WOR_SM1_SCG]